MRSLHLSLSGTIILVLLMGASVGVAAQSEEPAEGTEAVAPVVVSGTLECLGEVPAEEVGEEEAAAVEDGVVNLHRWEATDPRLSGDVTYTGQWQLFEEPAEDTGSAADADASVYAIVNEGGRWLCEASRAVSPGDRTGEHTLLFSGEGEYEGMTAYLQVDWSQAPYAFSGLILPGEAPPYAEPQG